MKQLLVVLPFYSGDVWLLKRNLQWYKQLDEHLPYEAVLACDFNTDFAEVKVLAEHLFKRVHIINYPVPKSPFWPYPQNNSFYYVAKSMKERGQPWLWLETDCTPLKRGWLDVLWQEYLRGGKPFGGHWNDRSKVFNGVGIYPSDVSKFAKSALNCKDTGSSWDSQASVQIFPVMHSLNHVMQHLWQLPDHPVEAPTFPDLAMVQRYVRSDVVLFHRCKDGSLMDRLQEAKGSHIELKGNDDVLPVPQVDIFCVTHGKDAPWCRQMLRSIQKFAKGFHAVKVLVPFKDKELFIKLHRELPIFDLQFFNEQPNKGMIHHEAMVCMADCYCNADYVLHMDADCIFMEPVTPMDYFDKQDYKPVMLKAAFNAVGSDVLRWQACVEKALGWKPEYETMQRHPAVHPRWLYKKVRDSVEQHTNQDFMQYVLSCENSFPQGFAEFPTLGAWALKHSPRTHFWIDVSNQPQPANKLLQFWSHGGFDRKIDNWKQTPAIFVGQTPKTVIQQVLG